MVVLEGVCIGEGVVVVVGVIVIKDVVFGIVVVGIFVCEFKKLDVKIVFKIEIM